MFGPTPVGVGGDAVFGPTLVVVGGDAVCLAQHQWGRVETLCVWPNTSSGGWRCCVFGPTLVAVGGDAVCLAQH